MDSIALAELIRTRVKSLDPSKYPDGKFNLCSISAFDNGKPEEITGNEIGSSKKVLIEGDVVISRIVPHIKRIWEVPILNNNITLGSSEWIVFNSPKIDGGYLRLFLQSNRFHKQFMGTVKGVGGSLLRADPKLTGKIKIPLPPLSTQKKIAAILDEADRLRQLNKQLIQKYDELTQSLFLDMFGDLVNNQKNWKQVNFGSVFKSLRYGTSSPPKYQDKGIPFIRATNVKKGNVALNGMAYISDEEASKIAKCKLNEGNLIVVRSGANTGDCCRIPKVYQDSYGGFDIIIEIDEPNSTFYNFLLNTGAGKAVLEPLSRRAGQPHLNSKQLTDLSVLNPPDSLQEQFSNRLIAIEAQKAQAQVALQKSEGLFNSLLQRAFLPAGRHGKGELVV